MDPFKGFANLSMILVGIVAAVIVIAAIVAVFHGNFIGILLIAIIVVLAL